VPVYIVANIKADTGSSAAHGKPSPEMIAAAQRRIDGAIALEMITDGRVTYTGDDLALTMVHERGVDSPVIHQFAWRTFEITTDIATEEGLYAAGQDMRADAPAGNIRGAGPGVAELEVQFGKTDFSERPSEAVIIFTADKCGPGVWNKWLGETLWNPNHNTGLLISPELRKGFTVEILDMDYTKGERVLTLELPEQTHEFVAITRNPDRFAILGVWSRAYPHQRIISASTDRLHNITGTYVGKDDPTMIARAQKPFPATEEYSESIATISLITTGDCRGSHNAVVLPMPINTAVTGPYCIPIVSMVGYSLNAKGKLAEQIDFFSGLEWGPIRDDLVRYYRTFREMGAHHVALASREEAAYTGIADLDAELDKQFVVRNPVREEKDVEKAVDAGDTSPS